MKSDKNYIKGLLPVRAEDSHKGTFGHVLNIAGSAFYSGAAYFSSIAPLRAGCGKVTLASVEAVIRSVSMLCPDLILMPLQETKEKFISSRSIKKLENKLNNFEVISAGCGLSMNKDTVKFFKKLIKLLIDFKKPVVIDADGLNILSLSEYSCLPENLILTPHPKELSNLMEISTENILLQPECWLKKCCEKFNCTTVLKLHRTLVADNKGNFYENKTGNSALSHGGSGDVLCGMISGFLAQGLNSFDASVLGVYLHGLAGELAAEDLTEYSVLASDLIKYIPAAIKTII